MEKSFPPAPFAQAWAFAWGMGVLFLRVTLTGLRGLDYPPRH